jgi:hypothetical protein
MRQRQLERRGNRTERVARKPRLAGLYFPQNLHQLVRSVSMARE